MSQYNSLTSIIASTGTLKELPNISRLAMRDLLSRMSLSDTASHIVTQSGERTLVFRLVNAVFSQGNALTIFPFSLQYSESTKYGRIHTGDNHTDYLLEIRPVISS